MGTARAPWLLVRLARGHGMVRSPLRRGLDRVEGWVATTLTALALLLVPVAVTVAMAIYGRELSDAAAVTAEHRPVSAVLVADAVVQRASSPLRGARPAATALVRWELPDGRQGSAHVPVTADQRIGDRLQLWVDRAGRHVDPPRSAVEVRTAAWIIGVDLVLAGWLLLGLMWWTLRQVLEQVNAERWRVEWVRTEPEWSRRSG